MMKVLENIARKLFILAFILTQLACVLGCFELDLDLFSDAPLEAKLFERQLDPPSKQYSKNLFAIVRQVCKKNEALCAKPIVVSLLVRYPYDDFPENLESGVLEGDLTTWWTTRWDHDGNPIAPPGGQFEMVPGAFSFTRIPDKSLRRPTADLVLTFQLRVGNDTQDSVHMGIISYEYLGERWEMVKSRVIELGGDGAVERIKR